MDQFVVPNAPPRELAADAFDLPPAEVQRRIAWARRQGQPAWLWPEVALAGWRDALIRIEQVLRSVLSDAPSTPTLECDLQALGVACYTSGTGPLLGYWIEQKRIAAPPAVEALLALHLRHNRIRMRKLTEHSRALAGAFADSGIDCILLKGMHTAHAYFPEPGMRPVSDIDMLIDPEFREPAARLLRRIGYVPGRINRRSRQQTWTLGGTPEVPRTLCLVHAADPWSLDLHASIDRRYGGGPAVARLDDVVECSPTGEWPAGSCARVLGQPTLLLHLAAHASCPLNSLSLIRLVELQLVIRRDRAKGLLSWPDFVALAERAGALGLIYPALRLCEELAPDTVPLWVLAECETRVPASVRRVVDPLTPADAQRVVRCSLAERFMWTGSAAGVVRQVLRETFLPAHSLRELLNIQRARVWRLARGTVGR